MFAIAASIMVLASVASISSAVYSPISENFVLVASGQALDRDEQVFNVEVSTSGLKFGRSNLVVLLRVVGGEVTIVPFGEFRIVGGNGILIQGYDFISLHIRIELPYGGPIAVWNMRGTTDAGYDNIIPLSSLNSRYILLPTLPHSIILHHLTLTGTITFA